MILPDVLQAQERLFARDVNAVCDNALHNVKDAERPVRRHVDVVDRGKVISVRGRNCNESVFVRVIYVDAVPSRKYYPPPVTCRYLPTE